ncbi:hypothetical protein GOP47_0013885 [Adiantum capillus-veneris]|uniref:Uncharacterized protein n=1 Tax=Adiantum capillus-veneris TaxID=13818 RepID=A0A9D4ZDT6_ADICA|nr:hypothetical protein GOP47_0013885 [Adiantum capillus-veneris]
MQPFRLPLMHLLLDDPVVAMIAAHPAEEEVFTKIDAAHDAAHPNDVPPSFVLADPSATLDAKALAVGKSTRSRPLAYGAFLVNPVLQILLCFNPSQSFPCLALLTQMLRHQRTQPLLRPLHLKFLLAVMLNQRLSFNPHEHFLNLLMLLLSVYTLVSLHTCMVLMMMK